MKLVVGLHSVGRRRRGRESVGTVLDRVAVAVAVARQLGEEVLGEVGSICG